MGGGGAITPKNDVDDAFGELFGTTKVASNSTLPIKTDENQAVLDAKPVAVATVALIAKDNDDGFGDFGNFGDFAGASSI